MCIKNEVDCLILLDLDLARLRSLDELLVSLNSLTPMDVDLRPLFFRAS